MSQINNQERKKEIQNKQKEENNTHKGKNQ